MYEAVWVLTPFYSAELNDFKNRWRLLIRMGHCVRAFENSLGNKTPADLKDLLEWSILSKGELLWLGKNRFCITLENVERSMFGYAKAISLTERRKPIEIQPEFIIPVRELLRKDKNLLEIDLNDECRKYITILSNTIRNKANAAGESWYQKHGEV